MSRSPWAQVPARSSLAFVALVLLCGLATSQQGPCLSPPPGSKLWSDPATWGGQLPQAGDEVTIAAADVVYMDINPPPLKSLLVMGSIVIGCRDFVLACDRIEVHGEFHVGSEEWPHHHRFKVILGNRYHDPADTTTKAFLVHGGAQLELHGERRSHSWLRLDETAPANQDWIRLEEPVDWRVGEEIVITSTDFDLHQAEERRIIEVRDQGRELVLDRPLTWTHWGEIESFVFDQRAEVALLDRNIEIRGDVDSESTRFGGHLMFMGHSDVTVHLEWTEFRRMGQIGELGRYQIHFHLNEDGTGNYVKHCSVHHCYNRSYTVHGTNNLLLEGNLSYDTIGHAFYLEDSTEIGNRFINNLGLITRLPDPEHQLTESDDRPSTFWITNTDNEFIGNVAAGSEALGFWYDLPEELWGNAPLPVFRDNRAHSNRLHGYYADHRLQPVGVALYERFMAYKNRGMGVWHRAYGEAIWDGALLADNRSGFYLASEGFQLDDFSFIAVINSAVLGESNNIGNPTFDIEEEYGRSLPNPYKPHQTITGFEVYDGLVAVDDTVFANYQSATFDGDTREAAAFGPVFHDNPWAVDPRNYVCDVSFIDCKVAFFKPPTAPANGVASTVLYDCDGSLTGSPDQWIAAATELITPFVGYHYEPDWNANIVPGPYTGPHHYAFGQLTFWDLALQGIFRIRVDSVDRVTGRDVYEPNLGLARYPITLLADEEYAITFPDTATRDLALEWRFTQPGRHALVGIEYANPPPAEVYVNDVLVQEVASIADLFTNGGNAYFYDDNTEKLYLLPITGGTGTSLLDGTATTITVHSGS